MDIEIKEIIKKRVNGRNVDIDKFLLNYEFIEEKQKFLYSMITYNLLNYSSSKYNYLYYFLYDYIFWSRMKIELILNFILEFYEINTNTYSLFKKIDTIKKNKNIPYKIRTNFNKLLNESLWEIIYMVGYENYLYCNFASNKLDILEEEEIILDKKYINLYVIFKNNYKETMKKFINNVDSFIKNFEDILLKISD